MNVGVPWLFLVVPWAGVRCVVMFFPVPTYFAIYKIPILTICLLVPSADNLCNQFGPGSGPTISRAWSRSKLSDTLMVFKNFSKELILRKHINRRQQLA